MGFLRLNWPGHNYTGPGNPLDNGKPVNQTDEASEMHDLAYAMYEDLGYYPYLQSNDADWEWNQNAGNDLPGFIGRAFWTAKSLFSPFRAIPSGTITMPIKRPGSPLEGHSGQGGIRLEAGGM